MQIDKIETTHNITLGKKKVPLLQVPEIRGVDSLLIDFCNDIHLVVAFKDVFCWKPDASAVSNPVHLVYA